ncbi:efflux RND transporter periplasmic adaptor subunit, partial [Odoribacter sp. OttesenSCG-928-G04]|nr:efflux RND transporter periplasmic adaptor subunit [Odoribacter sp. OttesenSCG-928-G04]
MKKRKTILIGSGIIVLALILAFVLFRNGGAELQVNTSKVSEKTIEITVMATGYVQPVEEVEVGTQVSGVIEKLYVDYNSVVKKGQLLAELDKMTLQEKLNQAKASLNSAQSDLNYAQQNYNRVKDLYDVKAATLVSYEDAINKLTQAQTSLENAKANLHQAEVNLSYAYIYSPIDGVVLDRSVNMGQTVAASFNTPTLFTIAEDLTKMQVEADVDEADIGQVKLGQKVTFTVDAFNDMIFTGTVSQIRLQPTVTNNVVTYTVIIEAPNPEEKLYPGMT